jgi:CheY-like chemotaxis protein
VWNGVEALELLHHEKFDLVFMDVKMPEMDGIEATKKIRLLENENKLIPIIILTGSVPSTQTDEYKKAGANTFLFKPFDVKRITMIVDVFAQEIQNNIADAGRPTDANGKSTLIEMPDLDIPDALPRFGDSETTYFSNLLDFIQSLPGRLDLINKSLLSGNLQQVSDLAHNLKGVSANYGAKHLSDLAASLDDAGRLNQSEACLNIWDRVNTSAAHLTELVKLEVELYSTRNKTLSGDS